AKAIAFGEDVQDDFKAYQEQVIENAKALATALEAGGLRIVFGGTVHHIVLVDVKDFGLTGKQAEEALDEVGITENKNTIPFDEASSFFTSCIRLGPTAMKTSCFTTEDMTEVGEIIVETLSRLKNDEDLNGIHEKVTKLTGKYPLYK